jgi:hypothetical protein
VTSFSVVLTALNVERESRGRVLRGTKAAIFGVKGGSEVANW